MLNKLNIPGKYNNGVIIVDVSLIEDVNKVVELFAKYHNNIMVEINEYSDFVEITLSGNPKPKDELDNIINNSCTCSDFKWKYHVCPYAQDIYNVSVYEQCSCCPYCSQQCAEDI